MIKPIHDKVVIKVKEAEKTTASGIVLPDTASEKTNIGTVIAVGEGVVKKDGNLRPLAVKPDDVVLYSKYAGSEAKYEGNEYLIVSEKDILAVIE